jgi:hypothetical protein
VSDYAYMSTEVWIRNPQFCIRECVDESVKNIVWDHGLLKKKRIDPRRFMELHYRPSDVWRSLTVSEYAATLISSQTEHIEANFPVWKYGESWAELEKMVTSEWMPDVPEEWNPVSGQPRRVVITYCPELNSEMGKQFFYELADLQAENPDTIIHVHGLYSYRGSFGLGFKASDVDVRTSAAKGKVLLPNGKVVEWERLHDQKYWCGLMGFDPRELTLPRNRCVWNIRSALWAGEHFADDMKFQHKGFWEIDPDQPLTRKPSRRNFLKLVKPLPSDNFFCNVCSLQASCKLFRVGAVCAVPGSEPADLVKLFESREPEQIRKGMSAILQVEARRVQDARQAETDKEEISPEVTRMLDRIFSHAERLLKVTDPKLLPAHVQAPGAGETFNWDSASPAQLAKYVTNRLQELGVPKEEITTQIIMDVINAPGDNPGEKIEAAASTLRALGSGS